MNIEGDVAPGFERVRDAFAEAQANDIGGAQLGVYRNGAIVVDLAAGRDRANDRPRLRVQPAAVGRHHRRTALGLVRRVARRSSLAHHPTCSTYRVKPMRSPYIRGGAG